MKFYKKTLFNKTRLKAGLTLLMTGLILAGCATVGPDYQAPELKPVELKSHQQTGEQATAIDYQAPMDIQQDWWQQFNDPQLSQLITIADTYNPSLAIAQANLAIALAIFDDVSNDDQLKARASAAYGVQRQVIFGDTSTNPQRPRLESRQLGLSAGWEIDLVGKFARAEEAANADAEAAYFAWQQARLSLLSQIANTYIDYRGLQARLTVAEGTLNSLSRTQAVVDSQVEVGFATRLDALRVKGQIAAVEAILPSLKAGAEAARQVLIALAGGEEKLVGFEWQPKAIPSLISPIALGHSADFLQQRPDVRAAERKLAAATANIGVARADLYPSLSLTGFLGFFSTQGQVIDSDSRAWSIAPGVQWNVFDLGSVRARIKGANAEQSASLAGFEQTVLNAISETRTSLSNYTQLQQKLYALDEQVQANSEALTLAQYQYKNGAINLLNLLDTERQWLSSRDEKVIAQAQMTGALIDIYSALGGGILVAQQ